jgi:integrase/recombinase XerC
MPIEEFLKYIKHEKRYSPHTCESYENDLNQFSAYIEETFEMDIVEASHAEVRDYMIFLMESGMAKRSVGRKLSSLRSFYKYLLREEKIASSPMTLIKAPAIPRRLPVFIDEHKMDDLLDSDKYFNAGFSSVRDKVIIETLFGTGMRLSELLKLEDKDLDVYNSVLHVLGKGNKERIIPITKQLVNQIEAYIKLKVEQNFDNKTHRLFVTDKGKDVSKGFVYKTVKVYLGYITTQDKKSPHVLRHSYATSMLNRGADLNDIKELLGHSSLAATQVYTHNTIEKLKLIYKQAHPKA